MKKLLCLALAVLMLLALAACAGNTTPTDPKNDTAPATQTPDTKAPDTQAPDTQAPETEAPAPAELPSPAEIEAAIAAALGDGYLATVDVPEEEIYMCPLGWVEDMSILDSWVAKQALISAVDLDNVVVAKCKDAADTEKVVNAFNNSFAQACGYVSQYPFNVAKVQNARIYCVGDTVMFLMAGASADAEADEEAAAQLAASEYEKIDAAVEALFGFLPENLAVVPEDSGSSGGGLLGG